jgi:hypothetical protein
MLPTSQTRWYDEEEVKSIVFRKSARTCFGISDGEDQSPYMHEDSGILGARSR